MPAGSVYCFFFLFSLLDAAFSLRLLVVLTRLIVRVLRCGGADWCGLVLDRVESWVRALGFPPFSLSPDPPDLLDASPKSQNKIGGNATWSVVGGEEASRGSLLTLTSKSPPDSSIAMSALV